MANLTISVDDETLKRARIRALERGESVNAYLAETLRRYVDEGSFVEALSELDAIAEEYHPGSGSDGRSWRRDDLYRV